MFQLFSSQFSDPKKVDQICHQRAKPQVQSAEVQEASFGVAHFDYDPVIWSHRASLLVDSLGPNEPKVQGLLLLGSSDFSWASRRELGFLAQLCNGQDTEIRCRYQDYVPLSCILAGELLAAKIQRKLAEPGTSKCLGRRRRRTYPVPRCLCPQPSTGTPICNYNKLWFCSTLVWILTWYILWFPIPIHQIILSEAGRGTNCCYEEGILWTVWARVQLSFPFVCTSLSVLCSCLREAFCWDRSQGCSNCRQLESSQDLSRKLWNMKKTHAIARAQRP